MNTNEIISFWANIMKDHADFIVTNLAYNETDYIRGGLFYKEQFTTIANEVPNQLTNDDLERLTALITSFIEYKSSIINRLLTCNILFGFTPTFINHMINEALEFINDINKIRYNTALEPVRENIMLHSVWLPDAAGHTNSIIEQLDGVEAYYIKIANDFKKRFNSLFIKNSELEKMLPRADLKNGTLEQFNNEVNLEITNFILFLEELKDLRTKCKVMGNLLPMVLDHMIREENYYLLSIQRVS